jgi:hypothetical protein
LPFSISMVIVYDSLTSIQLLSPSANWDILTSAKEKLLGLDDKREDECVCFTK